MAQLFVKLTQPKTSQALTSTWRGITDLGKHPTLTWHYSEILRENEGHSHQTQKAIETCHPLEGEWILVGLVFNNVCVKTPKTWILMKVDNGFSLVCCQLVNHHLNCGGSITKRIQQNNNQKKSLIDKDIFIPESRHNRGWVGGDTKDHDWTQLQTYNYQLHFNSLLYSGWVGGWVSVSAFFGQRISGPYKLCNHDLYIGIIISHKDNTQSSGYN